ncbi:MAG: hypothetical protein IPM17_06245 [Verrucomicrobia bacterium]|nr:hypothetical protein [Verrucomicrobiota bacterium]
MKRQLFLGLVGTALSLPLFAQPVLFSDNFDSDTAAQWDVLNGSNSGLPDFTAEFHYDYSRLGIPPAPNSVGGTTRGVKFTVNNNDDTPDTAAVNAYPKGRSFSGDYALRVDMWMGYNGPAFGGSGSTEFGIFGINHSGTVVTWDNANLTSSDGVWYAVAGEAGAAVDYRAYEGSPFGRPVLLNVFEAEMLDRDNNGQRENEVNPTQPLTFPLKAILPAPPGETPGAPGKQWVEVEVRQRGGELTWLINGFVIASRQNISGFDAGNIMIGTMDVFASIANPREENFTLFDNVRVVDLTGVPPLPVVAITASEEESTAVESGGQTLKFTVTRAGGDLAQPLTVNLRVSGTATPGADYPALPASVTIPAGQESVSTVITPNDDPFGEPDETIIIALARGIGSYEVRENVVVQLTIQDDGDVPVATIRADKSVAYERNPSRIGRFAIELNTPASTPITVPLTTSGTAASGVHYQALPTAVTFPAGETSVLLTVVPRDDNEINPDRTVEVTIGAGTGYVLGDNKAASVLIRNDDLPPGQVLFTENFDSNPAANWVVNQGPSDGVADFFFDYSTVGVPPAPGTSAPTRGLKLQANLTSGVFGGLSVSPAGQSFSGNYRLRFDLWQNFNGPFPDGGPGSTQIAGAGIGTAGTTPQWPGGTQDSLWFAATGDGGSGVDYRAYSPAAPTGYTEASGIFAANARDNGNPYYAELGRETAPDNQLALFPTQTGATYPGTMGMQWRDVVITKQGNTVTWHVDGLLIATVDVSAINFGGGNILFMHSDINAGSSTDPLAPDLAFSLVDNVRVEQLPAGPAEPATITNIAVSGSTVTLTFTAPGGAPGDFAVVGGAAVNGPYAPEVATITSTGANTFQAVLPAVGAARFYQITR